jgi:cobalt-zinc-cadmium resistance protein CzcA
MLVLAVLGLIPAAISKAIGSDVQRPLATVIIVGLLSSTMLSRIVTPVLYKLIPPEVTLTAAEKITVQ